MPLPSLSSLTSALEEYVEVRAAALTAARKELRVSELEARALTVIGAEPGIRPSALRDHLGVTSAGVTTLVDRLVERGLLRRELDSDDRRVNHIHLEIDLESEPWSALTRFTHDVDAMVRRETDAAAAALTDLLGRLTTSARSLV